MTHSAYRYGLLMLASCIALVVAVVGFNALVDPFETYRIVHVEGFNAYKPAIYNRVRLYKAFELQRVHAQTVILGTSRTHVGLRCSHEALVRLNEPCYNLAYDGATSREMYSYLRHAHAIQPLHHVVLGLDTWHLNSWPSPTQPGFDPRLLRDADTPAWWRVITGDLRVLASLDTLRLSVETLESQKSHEPSWFTADGQRSGDVFFHREGENFMRYGPRAYFDEIDRLEAGFQTQDPAPRQNSPGTTPAPPVTDESSLSYVRRIAEFCRREGIDLRIFITPSHVHQMEIAAATGAWPTIVQGKRALAQLLAEGKPPIPIYDFSGYSSITTEALPPVGSRQEMRYYWDSSHFKEQVGDYVLNRLFEVRTASRDMPRDFGMRLTADNVENVLAQQRVAQQAYRERFPDDIATLRSLVRAKPATGLSLVSTQLPTH
jgi:hypothetical protein